jgi:hypothetical protein
MAHGVRNGWSLMEITQESLSAASTMLVIHFALLLGVRTDFRHSDNYCTILLEREQSSPQLVNYSDR